MSIEVMIVEGQPILRRGLVASLGHVEGLGQTEEAGSVTEAWSNPALGEVDVVVLNAGLDGAAEFVAELEVFAGTRVLALGSRQSPSRLNALLDAGAMAGLDTEELTPQTLAIAIRAAAAGVPLVQRSSVAVADNPVATGHAPLNDREQQVLSLIADGMATRTVAIELHYSERTVKKVLGDVVVKLGARSRSQAIAYAVREGII